jgi:hypothetical protein
MLRRAWCVSVVWSIAHLPIPFVCTGPGNNLGLLASKSSPTAVRGQFYGVAAAIGKVGAFVCLICLECQFYLTSLHRSELGVSPLLPTWFETLTASLNAAFPPMIDGMSSHINL